VLNISVLPFATEELLHEMRMRGIYLSGSSACEKGARSHVIRAMGIEGPRADSVVRIGLGKKNTREEVTVLVETLNELIKRGK
jgi:cysteine desulfurase